MLQSNDCKGNVRKYIKQGAHFAEFCVKVMSNNIGSLYFFQVALRDLQMRGMPSNLLPGEPLCSPRTTVLLESTVQLLRRLHQCDQWASHINQYIHTHLELIGPLLREDDLGSFGPGQLDSSRYRQLCLYINIRKL